jgi:hypothetical protein
MKAHEALKEIRPDAATKIEWVKIHWQELFTRLLNWNVFGNWTQCAGQPPPTLQGVRFDSGLPASYRDVTEEAPLILSHMFGKPTLEVHFVL